MPDQRHALEGQRVEQLVHVARQAPQRDGPARQWDALAMAARVPGDHTVPAREAPHHTVPAAVRAAQAMHEHDRRPASGDVHRDRLAVDDDEWLLAPGPGAPPADQPEVAQRLEQARYAGEPRGAALVRPGRVIHRRC